MNLAFCPLLFKHARKGYCSRVACRDCKLPAAEFEDREIAWLCTTCSDEALEYLPYWGDGRCEGCGAESGVLLLCVLLD